MIGFERQVNKGQLSLLPDLDLAEVSNGKTAEAARLFASRRSRFPYYWGFDTLSNIASGNVEQLLSTSAALVDRMIYRAELGRDKAISAKEQEEIFKRCATTTELLRRSTGAVLQSANSWIISGCFARR